MKLKKLWLYLLTPLLVLFGSAVFANTAQAKELTNVITSVNLWDLDNGQVKAPNADGSYTLTTNTSYANYKYVLDFDLSKYDGNLSDGDTFTFTIPAPITVKAEEFDLKDKETDVAVGNAKVVSNGDGQGGKVTVTLKNLKDYLEKKGGTQIQGVAGTLYVGFSVKEVVSEKTITYPTTETKDTVTQVIKVKQPDVPDYGYEIGVTNFAKVSGIITKGNWTSALLGKSGEYYHPFVVRVNDRQESYNVIDIHDYISADYAPAQFVPESLKIESGYYDNKYTFQDVKEMTQGSDYTIEWNESYTDFKIKITNASVRLASNGKPASYRITYKTTAPADGTKISNSVEVAGDDVPLTYRTDRTANIVKVWRNSQVTSGGSIQLKTGYRITLYKVDSKTQNRLAGAKFKITPPAGATAQEEIVETNEEGVAQSSVYSEADVKLGEFTVTEVEAPVGYELDPTPFKVTVGKDGVLKTVTNTKFTTKAQIVATKKLTGRTLKAGEFEFTLSKDGKDIQTVKNDADGNITFDKLTFDTAGTYNYTITEKNAGTADEKGVTYDSQPVEVTVEVTADATGKLTSTVSYANNDNTFENIYKPTPTNAGFAVTKKLTGRELKAGEFEFVLKGEDGSELQKVNNTADGAVIFEPITYDTAGVYKYTIEETNAGQTIDNVVYDDLKVDVTVTVTDDGEGNLDSKIAYSDDKEFNNEYVEPTTTTTTTTTTTEETTTTTTTTSEEPTTTTTSEEPTTTTTSEEATTTTTSEEATTTTTSEEATTTTTSEEATTTTTSEEATTTTTSEEPTTTTTSEEPTTTTTSEEATTTTTSEEPTTTTTSEEATTTTTSEEPTTTTTTTTGEKPNQPETTTTSKPKKPGLPSTGEKGGLVATVLGVIVLVAAIVAAVVYYRRSKNA
ncbi:Spy0128 family protein [Streptococcus orisratti]